MKIGGVYILSRRSIARMLAAITAALMMLYAAATAPVEDMVRRIHDVAGGFSRLTVRWSAASCAPSCPIFFIWSTSRCIWR